jgi:hypothetical protein
VKCLVSQQITWSAAGLDPLHTAEVSGSNPLAPTQLLFRQHFGSSDFSGVHRSRQQAPDGSEARRYPTYPAIGDTLHVESGRAIWDTSPPSELAASTTGIGIHIPPDPLDARIGPDHR